MFKKILALVLCGLMTFGLAGCAFLENLPFGKTDGSSADSDTEAPSDSSEGTESETAAKTEAPTTAEKEPPKEPPVEKVSTTTKLSSNTLGIKLLGERFIYSETQINCDWTCSGIEFVLNSIGGDLTVEAGSAKPCYFRVFVDGYEWVSKKGSDYYEVKGDTRFVVPAIPAGEHTVRIVKVTGHTLATAQLYSLTYYGTISETAPADQELYIEYLGDSISCGWGVVGAHDGSYSAQDGALAYPYLLSQKLNADYCVTALSGQGVLFHGAPNVNMTTGYLLTSPNRDGAVTYDFARKADVVVINMGTNDYSNRNKGDGITEAQFADAYKALIQTVREKNGADCKILCLYNTMNDTFANAILSVCNELGGQKAGIYSHEMTRTASGHPTVKENEAYVTALEAVMNHILNGVVAGEKELNTEASGDGLSVGFGDFKPWEG